MQPAKARPVGRFPSPPPIPEVDRFVDELRRGYSSRGQVVHLRHILPKSPIYGELSDPLPGPLGDALRNIGVDQLYTHQCTAIEAARAGKHPLVVTSTASGKSLTYLLPILEQLLTDRSARALLLFPIKALEQDQLKTIHALLPWGHDIRAAIVDGDTPASRRAKLREDPPQLLLSNPDLLHLSLLPHHAKWREFWRNLRYVVVDELHTYRGVFGSHIAHVLRRLRRVAAAYGASPQFMACSATISNPLDLSEQLTGLAFHLVDDDGAPQQGKRFLLINPINSPYTEATDLLLRCLRKGLKTIAFAKARKITELIAMWTRQADPTLGGKLAAYRAGFTAEERRAIERGLFTEQLAGVVTTSALELGIDVGGLDACLLVGYPGSITSTWQRSGRVGRGRREALIILIALPDALDQYFFRHPDDFFSRPYEAAIVDPGNRQILAAHLVAAAAEVPLRFDDSFYATEKDLIQSLHDQGRLLLSADGTEWYARERHPQRRINIRSLGEACAILDQTGRAIGTIDGIRALHECHPGAIYLHQGQQHEIVSLDLIQHKIHAKPVTVDYYTSPLAEKDTEILEILESLSHQGIPYHLGRLKVTERVLGYERRRIFGQDKIGSYQLDLPPQTFETVGLWFEVPDGLKAAVEAEGLHFMGSIHAVEHAMIGLFPLYALCDRSDIGGISYPIHPQIGRAAIFIYDGYPGGIGLTERGFRVLPELFLKTRQLLEECPCECGCPSCVHSPKCGSGNKPLDKQGAHMTLQGLLGEAAWDATQPTGRSSAVTSEPLMKQESEIAATESHAIVFDLETQRSAEDVGGWEHRHRMGLAVGVVYDLDRAEFRVYTERQVDALITDLVQARLIVGFNLRRFDFDVLRAYADVDWTALPTLDILECVHRRLGFRLKLDHLAQETLGEGKSADGLQSLAWFKAGEIERVIEYCKQDVLLTKRLYDFGRQHGYLLYRDLQGRAVRLPVDFDENLFSRQLR
ncbi:MAG: DEAD/DEAH box helicase [bacterium]|uniref:DEAD/DEAH box helicase n=1 Tax=Candidatus Methylomirabilis tolerans TaxID=3123416 RepID=A0AAJ1AKG7_9BACT|nr:DEAD/DEAH box helicase [Candidatus Methylomirabilis sp.]